MPGLPFFFLLELVSARSGLADRGSSELRIAEALP
jgi:hypothetical protein